MQKVLAALRRSDKILLVSMLLIFSIGATILYSVGLASQEQQISLLYKQLFYGVLGMGAFLFFMTVDYRTWQPFYPWLYLLCIFFLVLLFTPLGEVIRGIRAWLDFGFFVWQPVELVKFLLILILAAYFSKQGRHLKTWKPLIVSGLSVGLLGFLTIAQPDLGSAVILFLIWLGFVLLLGLSKWQIGLMFFGFLGIVLVGWTTFLQPYQKSRLVSFLDPAADPLGTGYNVTQSLIAIGSGRLLGRGIGSGSQSQLQFLPERQTDFIFAVIGEELGFAGIFVFVALLVIISWRLIHIARNTRSDFGQLIAIGVLLAVVGQAMLHMAMNLALIPVTGISLPLISAGGSYLVAVFMMLGLAQSVHIYS